MSGALRKSEADELQAELAAALAEIARLKAELGAALDDDARKFTITWAIEPARVAPWHEVARQMSVIVDDQGEVGNGRCHEYRFTARGIRKLCEFHSRVEAVEGDALKEQCAKLETALTGVLRILGAPAPAPFEIRLSPEVAIARETLASLPTPEPAPGRAAQIAYGESPRPAATGTPPNPWGAFLLKEAIDNPTMLDQFAVGAYSACKTLAEFRSVTANLERAKEIAGRQ